MITEKLLLDTVRPRYLRADRKTKHRILDEFVACTGYHRKYAIHVLRHPTRERTQRRRPRRKAYMPEVVLALEQVWEVANYICGKRSVSMLKEFVEALERHGEICLDAATRQLLLQLRPATADRLLKRAAARNAREV